MKLIAASLVVVLLSYSCNNGSENKKNRSGLPKGELAFLLQYNNKNPQDVGFLSNHIVTRRLANIWKDKTASIQQLEPFGEQIKVEENTVTASFISTNGKAFLILIDVWQDAIVTGYKDSSTCEIRWERESLKELKGFCK